MSFCNKVVDMQGALLLFKNGECESIIPTSWVEIDPTGLRFKNEFGQMTVLDADAYQHIAFKKEAAIFTEDVILLK